MGGCAQAPIFKKGLKVLPIKTEIAALLSEALKKSQTVLSAAELESSFEIPREEKFGDLSSHIILKLAKETKRPPRPLAEEVLKNFDSLLKNSPLKARISRGAVEGPGFLNFYYSNQEIAAVVSEIRQKGRDFGRPRIVSKKILLEFVSANPTGPLTVAHGRQAALGDSLARILKFCGHKVTKEYYNNDEGVQISTLGASTRLRVLQSLGDSSEMPENYYRGEYLIEVAKALLALKGKDFFSDKISEKEQIEVCRLFARDCILEGIKKDLADFDVFFDHYYSQEALAKSGKVEKTLEELKKKNMVYEKDGAYWLRSTDFGDDKDRVVKKSTGEYTYLAPDIAYHLSKYERGYNMLVNFWGPDHHGYIPRLKAACQVLGYPPEAIHIGAVQLTTLFRKGQPVRMSTRAGEFVTLRELYQEVGVDATRFFFVMRRQESPLDFDLDLAKEQSQENPVFYLQYAHARIASLAKYAEQGITTKVDLKLLATPEEAELIGCLSQFSDYLIQASRSKEPYRLADYLRQVAASFHKFYSHHRVVTEDKELTKARLLLADATRIVLRNGLELLGISQPESM